MIPMASKCKSLDHDWNAFAVTVEFRCVHALDVGDPGFILTAKLDPSGILEHVRSLGQIVDKEVTGSVSRRFIIAQAILILVPRQHVDWLGSAPAVVLQMHVLHVAVGPQHDPYNQ